MTTLPRGLLVVFLAILLKADYKTGELTCGRNQLGYWTGLKPITAYRTMRRLKRDGMINTQSNYQFTKILICNWKEYQSPDNKVDNSLNNDEVTTKYQRNNTLQEVKNIRSKEIPGKELSLLARKFPSIPSQDIEAMYRNLSTDPTVKNPAALLTTKLKELKS